MLYILLLLSFICSPLWGADNLFDLEKYRPNAPWITEELMSLDIDQFNLAFKESVIDILVPEENRWFYFCDKKENFSLNDYWYQCLWQCQYYDNWLDKLYVDSTGKLCDKEDIESEDEAISIFDYWQEIEKQLENGQYMPYHQFYAFYADILSHFFCQTLEFANYSLNDPKTYKLCLSVCKKCFKQFEKIISKFKSSILYSQYHFASKRYQELLNLAYQDRLSKKM